MKKYRVVMGLIVLTFLIAAGWIWRDARAGFFIYSKSGPHHFKVEVAATSADREYGLMYRTFLPDNQGMLFVFEDSALRSFWMKNTNIPLDLIFFDEHWQIVDMKESFAPCQSEPCPSYTSIVPAKYVLEIRGASVKEKQIQMFDRAEWRH